MLLLTVPLTLLFDHSDKAIWTVANGIQSNWIFNSTFAYMLLSALFYVDFLLRLLRFLIIGFGEGCVYVLSTVAVSIVLILSLPVDYIHLEWVCRLVYMIPRLIVVFLGCIRNSHSELSNCKCPHFVSVRSDSFCFSIFIITLLRVRKWLLDLSTMVGWLVGVFVCVSWYSSCCFIAKLLVNWSVNANWSFCHTVVLT